MLSLEQYGWSNFHQTCFDQRVKSDLSAGRVTSIKGFKYLLISQHGEVETELSGKLLYATSQEDLPKVGDWVLFMPYDSMGYVIEVMPRINGLSRKNPGTKTEKQVLAANIDMALIVQGLDRDFNLMRLERYLVQLSSCNIVASVILNKADLVADPESFREQVRKLGRDCHVHLCSTYSGSGIEQLKTEALEKNKTYILVGSSGVGKSSLLNALMDDEKQKTGSTSDQTSKGKHTTTTRDLFQLPNGSLIIDTPGMREFGLTSDDSQNTDELFPLIQMFGEKCRFSDCTHLNETGCAVIEAYDNGTLEREVYDSYVKLKKEQKRFEIRVEDKKRMGKQSGRMSREANNFRKKFKY
jgi:ribosome biogenesis GTPase / thiamine phosphate phosphatase